MNRRSFLTGLTALPALARGIFQMPEMAIKKLSAPKPDPAILNWLGFDRLRPQTLNSVILEGFAGSEIVMQHFIDDYRARGYDVTVVDASYIATVPNCYLKNTRGFDEWDSPENHASRCHVLVVDNVTNPIHHTHSDRDNYARMLRRLVMTNGFTASVLFGTANRLPERYRLHREENALAICSLRELHAASQIVLVKHSESVYRLQVLKYPYSLRTNWEVLSDLARYPQARPCVKLLPTE